MQTCQQFTRAPERCTCPPTRVAPSSVQNCSRRSSTETTASTLRDIAYVYTRQCVADTGLWASSRGAPIAAPTFLIKSFCSRTHVDDRRTTVSTHRANCFSQFLWRKLAWALFI